MARHERFHAEMKKILQANRQKFNSWYTFSKSCVHFSNNGRTNESRWSNSSCNIFILEIAHYFFENTPDAVAFLQKSHPWPNLNKID